MKLDNATHYSGVDLRRLIRAALVHEGVNPKRYRVEVCYRHGRTNRGFVGGLGSYVSPWLRLKVPKVDGDMPPSMVREVAQVVAHEVAHNRGLRHREMICDHRYDLGWIDTAKVPFVIRRRAARVAERPPLQQVRAERATSKLSEWERRAKVAAAKVKHYRAKVRYYERALAARQPKDGAS